MYIKKILTAVLVSAMILASLSGCGSKDDETTGNISTSENANSPGEEAQDNAVESTTEKMLPNVPDMDFDGYEFKMLVRGEGDGVWASRDIIADEENGEPINDAVYKRNQYIEDKYNVKIVGIGTTSSTGSSAAMKKVILAGDDAYDVMIPRQDQVGTLITGNLLIDLTTVPYLDLQKPWWDQNVMRDLSIRNKIYTTAGDIHVTTNNAIRILLFNKDMIRDFGLENPYELVKTNKWTLDKFYDMCKDISLDVDGNGTFDQNDQYGYLVQTGITVNMLYACGENMTEKDETDTPHISIGSEKSILAMEKIVNILSSKNAVMFDSDYSNAEHALREVFENKRGLFFAEVLQLAERMRATDTDFGILPMPKYDETQESYLHFADSWCMSLVTIPVTNTNLERTGILLEAMAAESKYTLTPAYYDKTLQGKYMRDDESSEMLDIIINSKIVSQDELFGWGLQTAVQTAFRNLSYDFVSTLEKEIPKTEAKIEKTLFSIEE